MAAMLAAWRADLADDLPTVRTPVMPPPVASPPASVTPMRRRRRLVAAVAAGVVALGGVTTAAASVAGPGSPLWPVTRVLFPDRADSRVAQQEAERTRSRAREAVAESRYSDAEQLLNEAAARTAEVTEPKVVERPPGRDRRRPGAPTRAPRRPGPPGRRPVRRYAQPRPRPAPPAAPFPRLPRPRGRPAPASAADVADPPAPVAAPVLPIPLPSLPLSGPRPLTAAPRSPTLDDPGTFGGFRDPLAPNSLLHSGQLRMVTVVRRAALTSAPGPPDVPR